MSDEYTKRLEILNRNTTEQEVLDSIDRPIRPLVIELNRVGFKTIFSCCGYKYNDEEEPKSHSKFTYVQFEVLFNPQSLANFMALASSLQGWQLRPLLSLYRWSLSFLPLHSDEWGGDPHDPAIHDYEHRAIAIRSMTRFLKTLPHVNEEVTIVDGNKAYHEDYKMEEWLVKPKRDSVVKCSQDTP